MLKAWLRGEALPRPLLLPTLFSLGARLENLPLRSFHSNPTKIASALRQIRAVLKVDGVAAYFDPYMEAEALGCVREWRNDGSSVPCWPEGTSADDLRAKLTSLGDLAEKGPLRHACDVLQRAKAMLKDEPALMVRVSGPFELARQLVSGAVADERVEFAAEICASTVKTLAEAGADVILIAEELPAKLSGERCAWWASLLAPAINVARFYQAMPVLLLGGTEVSVEANLAVVFERSWDCVLCLETTKAAFLHKLLSQTGGNHIGLSLPTELFGGDSSFLALREPVFEAASGRKVTMFASAGDIPPNTDMKQLAATLNEMREAFAQAASRG